MSECSSSPTFPSPSVWVGHVWTHVTWRALLCLLSNADKGRNVD